jgi:hypothetical protein
MAQITPRLDLLEKMNDRYELLLHNKDKQGLLDLALEYENLGALHQASRIRFKVKNL